MKKIKLALGIHNHQPIGNFDFVFEEAYQKAYLPFLNILESHPKIRLAQHFTGVLFEWLLKRDAEFGPRLKQMVAAGQIEMMSGGYYEPILVNIPDDDKLGQIEKLNQFVKRHTGYQPIGLWLAERIWEPQLPKPLAQTGAKYVVIDDSHFKAAGLEEKDLYGYYTTEETGSIINIFPISEKLRYTIPFQEPQVTIDYLQSIASEAGDKLVVFADDGEKFGIWPQTYKHCYENQWLERFFLALEQNLDWIEIIHFSDALAILPPVGRVYLPTASYREMMEWALPSKTILRFESFESKLKENGMFEDFKVFVRGGFWRNFLAKYPESNNLHKKSLRVSQKLTQLKAGKNYDEKLFNQAQDLLWAGQTNCPYWHGIFGGLYLNNLRYAVYSNMIKAEAIIDKIVRSSAEYNKGWVDIQVVDFDADGRDEVIVESKIFNLYFAAHSGGALFECDYKPKSLNLLDTMTRRQEAYHQKLIELKEKQESHTPSNTMSIHDMVTTKEPGLEERLKYDWYRRVSLIDHFLSPGTSLENFANCEYQEAGDFVLAPYAFQKQQIEDLATVQFLREGLVQDNGSARKIRLSKRINIPARENELEISYHIKNLADQPAALWFAVEFNFALLAGHAPDRYYYFEKDFEGGNYLASLGRLAEAFFVGLKDEWLKVDIQLRCDKAAEIWRFPIETISQSESGFERVYQSSAVLPNWKINLLPLETWTVKLTLKISEL